MKTKRINNININGITYEVGGTSIEVVQERGDSTEAVMSQNAVTEFCDTLDGRVTEAEEDIGFVKNRLGLLIADRTATGNGSYWNVPSNALEYASIVKIGGLTRTVPGAVVDEVNTNGIDYNASSDVSIEYIGDNRFRFNGTCYADWMGAVLCGNGASAYEGDTWYTSVELISGSASAGETYVSPHINAHYHNCVYFSDTIGEVVSGSTHFVNEGDAWTGGVYVGFANGATFNDAVYEFKCGRSMGVGSVEPSIISAIVSGGITIPIPDAVKNMSCYGHGIDANCYNYIDAENGVYVRMCDYQMGEVVPIAPITTKLSDEFVALISKPLRINAGSYVQFIGGSAQYEIDYQVKV